MKTRHVKLVIGTMATALAVSIVLLGERAERSIGTGAEDLLTSSGRGSAAELEANYRDWEASYLRNGGDRNLVLPVGAFKGMVTEHSDAHGYARFNLIDGTIAASFQDLPATRQWDLWIMEDKVGTALPDAGDTLIRVGGLQQEGDSFSLDANLGSEAFANFDLTYVIVTPAGKHPSEERMLVGTTTLFHALYRSAQRGAFGVVGNPPAATTEEEQVDWLTASANLLVPAARADLGPIPNPGNALQQMITRGRNIFFNEKFNGNGRTCGTCHREEESLTISTDFISELPPDDPLFVAEFNPALARNFENPVLMRRFGLILDNLDGFDNLQNKFVMRGIPHALAINANTLAPALVDGTLGAFAGPPSPTTPIIPGTDPSIRERTGWGGDGAPGTGTLREFLQGAIMQHYPRTLGRVPGTDFRLATNQELLDTEAFMRSTGRRKDLNLGGMLAQNPGDPVLRLRDVQAAQGQRIFTNPGNVPGLIPGSNKGAGKCFLCHSGAGAGDSIEQLLFQQANALGNANFATGVQSLPSLPADLAGQPNPLDQGFGRAPNPGGGFGDGTFNVPVLIEAADTPGFFHNNAVDTIEAAVSFYQGPTFNNSPAGQLAGGIELDATEVDAVAKFLRVLNSLENLNSSIDLARRARSTVSFDTARELLNIELAELDDAFEVLRAAGLHQDARREILAATGIIARAAVTISPLIRNALIDEAVERKNRAIRAMRS